MEGHIPMSEETLWYGYLQAGEKSAPVVLDSRLNTGLPETVYVYNHGRGAILEYKRVIAEPKLRELTAEEKKELLTELRRAYRQARKAFTPRVSRANSVAEKARAPRPQPVEVAFEAPEVEDDYEDSFADGMDEDTVAA